MCIRDSYYAGTAGIPTVGFGGSDEEFAHIADEYIEISQLVSACKGYYAIAKEVLGLSSVSYTHLDVYKRQVFGSGMKALLGLRVLVRGPE